MNVSDCDFREVATSEFLKRGLGAKLTQNSHALIRGLSRNAFSHQGQWAIKFACGSIMERVIWQAQGIWMGYFNPAQAVTPFDQEFLLKHRVLLEKLEMPPQYQELGLHLESLSSATGEHFYAETLGLFPLSRPMPEWFAPFQASLIAAELLNEPVITSFFLFLQDGDAEYFKRQIPDPGAVFSHLQDNDFAAPFHGDTKEPEPIIAGFIRYTEFLSAMDGIFPDVSTKSFAEGDEEIPNRIVDRDILFAALNQYRWRIPARARERYEAVLYAFGRLTASEFDRNPAMGVRWSFAETFTNISRLSQKFFPELEEGDLQGAADPTVDDEKQRRARAIRLRLRALQEDQWSGATASTL